MSSSVLYAEIQQFYATQMRRLDALDFAGFAATFVEDCAFSHGGDGPPVRGREAFLAYLESVHEGFDLGTERRRHWFNMIEIVGDDAETITVNIYAMVLLNRAGSPPEIEMTCVVDDVLTRIDGGLATVSRTILLD